MSYKYEGFAESRFMITNRTGTEYMVKCVFHEDSNASMQFNVESGLFLCFACKASGNIKTLEHFYGITVVESGMDLDTLLGKIDSLKNPEPELLPVLNESFLKRYSMPTRYWKTRGFEKKTVEAFDLGYDPMGDHSGPYVTIPLRNTQGQLLGVIKRYLDPNAELRYRYPKGFKRSQNLFASWMVEKDPDAHTVALVEGSIDAMKVWQAGHPAMALYGSSINPAQVRILRRLGVRNIILFTDNDKAGKEAIDTCQGWHQRKRGSLMKWEYDERTDLRREFLVSRVVYPSGAPSDPGAMDTEMIGSLLHKAKRVR